MTRVFPMSNFDSLTDLPNRSSWELLMAKKARSGLPLIIVIIVINDINHINIHFGRQVGDISLIATAGIIKGSVRPSDFVARIGGDRFGIIVNPSGANPKKLISIIKNRLRDKLRDYNLDSNIPVRFTIGAAYSLKNHDPAKLILKASPQAKS